MSTEAAFLADILADPADDTPRLIYADWLDEHGRPERAEFIRVQCRIGAMKLEYDPLSPLPEGHPAHAEWEALRRREWELLGAHGFDWLTADLGPLAGILNREGEFLDWLVRTCRRGFVESVTCTLADWCGATCEGCYGSDEVTPAGHANWRRSECPHCHGSGRVGGHGPALVRACPLERVTLGDREPDGSDLVSWSSHPQGETLGDADELPWDLFLLLPGEATDLPTNRRREQLSRQHLAGRWRWKCYDTKALALDALSRACLKSALTQLPPARDRPRHGRRSNTLPVLSSRGHKRD